MNKSERLYDYISWRNKKGELPSVRSLKYKHLEFINKDTDESSKISQRQIQNVLTDLLADGRVVLINLETKKKVKYVGYRVNDTASPSNPNGYCVSGESDARCEKRCDMGRK